MIPQTDSTEFQLAVLEKVRSAYESDSDLNDRVLLNAIFLNYRRGGGMRLSKFGSDICVQNKLYDFAAIDLPRSIKGSVLYTSLDRICKTPYYVEGFKVYISDEIVLTELTFCCDDFEKLFQIYLT